MANLKNFADLKSLSAQLKAESEKKREKPYVKKKCVRQLQEANIFRTAVAGVTPVRTVQRHVPETQRPAHCRFSISLMSRRR
jgi:hypothetical protein